MAENHLKETPSSLSQLPLELHPPPSSFAAIALRQAERCQNDEAAFGAGCCRDTSTRPKQELPPTLPHPAQVSFIFILLYSCFSGRCGTRTDIRLTNNAATAPKSSPTSSLTSLSLLPSVFIVSLSLSLYFSLSLSLPLSLCVPGQIDVRQPTLEIALRGHCSHGKRCCARNRRSATAPREYKMLA